MSWPVVSRPVGARSRHPGLAHNLSRTPAAPGSRERQRIPSWRQLDGGRRPPARAHGQHHVHMIKLADRAHACPWKPRLMLPVRMWPTWAAMSAWMARLLPSTTCSPACAGPRWTSPRPSVTWSPATAAGPSPATPEFMAWLNEEVAGLLREYAELTQITGGDVFRARNYEKAARSVRGWGDDIGPLDARALRAIPGVGASIAAKIAEYRESGSIRALDELRAKIPAGVLELTRVPGLGPKRALQLNHDLGVSSVDELATAVKAGRLDGLAGFGAKSEERIAAGIEVYRQGRERVLLDVALRTANEMVGALAPISQRCAYAGSLRRWRETIGDIDILAAAGDSAPLMAAFAAGHDVVASGPTKTTVRTASGLTADLRVVPLDAWGAALQYFTGSTAHNVAVRQIAVRA